MLQMTTELSQLRFLFRLEYPGRYDFTKHMIVDNANYYCRCCRFYVNIAYVGSAKYKLCYMCSYMDERCCFANP